MENRAMPRAGEFYMHFKGKLYQIVTVAIHTETEEPLVVYQAMYGTFKTYARPLEMFLSEVDHEKYPEVTQKYRFQYVDPETISQKEENVSAATMCQKEEPVSTSVENDNKEIEKTVVASPEDDTIEQINPWLLRFLDAETMEEKYQIVCDIKNEITDRLIDDLAVVVDVVIPEGKLSDRYDQLKYCIRTRQKYEQTSLWRK